LDEDKSKALGVVSEVSASKPEAENSLGDAIELAKKSTKIAAPVSAALGTIVTLLYCLRIGYLPIDGLESIATLGATESPRVS
jgi:hypothetical protein